MTAPTRPVLRYHGGKWRLAPWIIQHLPAHRVYVEPFGGAASVLMRKPRAHVEVYNDLDGELVALFRVLRDAAGAERLRDLLRLTPFARAEYAAAHIPSDDPIEQARRTLVKAWMGFGSGALTHKHAGWRVAFSERRHTAKEWARFADTIPAVRERLAGVFLEQRPALEVIRRYDADDAVLFLDPPYVASTRGPRHRYRHEMTEADHEALAVAARAACGAVVVCGYECDLYRDLFAGWTTQQRPARDAKARARTETLWLNQRCSAALDAQLVQVPA